MSTRFALILCGVLSAGTFAIPVFATTTEIGDATTTSEATPTSAPTPVVDTRRVTLSSVAQVRLTNLAANISNQLDASIRRNDNVLRRLESRRQILADSGIDTTAAEGVIRDGIAANDAARGFLSTIDTEVAAFVGSSNPREQFIILRNRYISTYEAVTGAHSKAVEALLLLQSAGSTPVVDTATTSAETPTE